MCFMKRGKGLSYFVDNGYSWHITNIKFTFLNLKQHDKGKIALRGIETIFGTGTIGVSSLVSIKNVLKD